MRKEEGWHSVINCVSHRLEACLSLLHCSMWSVAWASFCRHFYGGGHWTQWEPRCASPLFWKIMSSMQSWVTQQDNMCFGCGRLEFKISCWWPWKHPNAKSTIFIFNLLYNVPHKSWDIDAVLCPQVILRGLKLMQKAWQQVGKLLLTPLLSSLFRCVAEFPNISKNTFFCRGSKGKWARATEVRQGGICTAAVNLTVLSPWN